MKLLEDQMLWDRFIEGEEEAFSALFMRYHPLLINYGLRISQNEGLAEECVQDLFCYLYERRGKLKTITSIKGYLLVSFRRRIIRACNEPVSPFSPSLDANRSGALEPTIEDQIISGEHQSFLKSRLKNLLTALPIRQREVIYLKYYSGLDTAEIKTVMGISHQGVLNVLYKALKSLKHLSGSHDVVGPN